MRRFNANTVSKVNYFRRLRNFYLDLRHMMMGNNGQNRIKLNNGLVYDMLQNHPTMAGMLRRRGFGVEVGVSHVEISVYGSKI